MGVNIDLRVAQLLCSRLCHDLVGPSGAVNAGLELLAEASVPADGPDGALALVGRSARELARRLAYFRVAFGSGGGDRGLADAHDLAADLLADGNVRLAWRGPAADDAGVAPAAGKLLMNLILIGVDSLPRGGALEVRFAALPEGLAVALTATGQGARLKEDLRQALVNGLAVEEVTARNVHGYLCRCLADSLGIEVEVSDGNAGEVRYAVLLPNAGRA